jgi:hypothetical protein
VGALFRSARSTHINRVCFHITSPSLRSRDILVKGRKHTVVCRRQAEWVPRGHGVT